MSNSSKGAALITGASLVGAGESGGEAVEFAKRPKDAGVDVTLRSLPEGQHNFILGAGRVPEVDEAIGEIGRWLRSKLGLARLDGRSTGAPTGAPAHR